MKDQKRTALRSRITRRMTALLLAAALSVITIIPVTNVPAEAARTTTWGVFIGTHLKNTSRIKNYRHIVIDAQNYTKSEISKLKSGGRKVYSYLSIGSIANYRPYYKRFKKYKKGVDGLWVDNTDVYYEYHRTPILNGLISILTRIKNKKIPIVINGGDVFVSKIISMGKAKIIDGVMQEEVLTRIVGYNSNKFKRQTNADRKYYEAYLKKVKRAGRTIAILEYTKSSQMRKEIKKPMTESQT